MSKQLSTTEYIKITQGELKQSDITFVYIKIKDNYFIALHNKGEIKLNVQSEFISAESIINSGYEIYIPNRGVSS